MEDHVKEEVSHGASSSDLGTTLKMEDPVKEEVSDGAPSGDFSIPQIIM